MKANASQGSGAKAKKKTSYAAQYKKMTGVAPRQKTKTESVSSVTAGVKTNRVSDKKKAATRSMVANAALMAVPGGAAVKGVTTAAKVVGKVAKHSRVTTVSGAVNDVRGMSAFRKASKVRSASKEAKLNAKGARLMDKGTEQYNSEKAVIKREKFATKAALKKPKSSGAIKRMK
jgi:hypothetical protein